ncbi:glutathione S-transferase family protein [Emcibacter sp.]|uniref:glutathione S-transferase family protein n=1 Tax=Emcibacter sp. TaxID=1979954 RepID=UPI002AA842EC|nr:glutathione S-transferase family protein [Emcibacter sp.]
MIRLFHRPDCPFCWKVRIALYELDIPFEEITITLGEKNPDVMALNPNGSVPVMVTEDGPVLWESAAMMEYLEDEYGREKQGGSLLPEEASDRAVIRQIHIFSDNQVGKAVFPLVRERRSHPGRDVPADLLHKSQKDWQSCLTVLQDGLGDREFFGGDLFSIADCALIPRFTLAEVYGLAVPEEFAAVGDWYRRVSGRPSVAKARPDHFPGVNDFVKSAGLAS